MRTTPADHAALIAGDRVTPGRWKDVACKSSGEPIGRVALVGKAEIDRAIAGIAESARAMREAPTFKRREVIEHVHGRLVEHREELATLIVGEVGKPIRDGRGEVSRAIETFRLAAAECGRIDGVSMPLDTHEPTSGMEAVVRRFPVGPCAFIVPFNFPLNLAAHKIAPALAVGCPFVVKPDPRTPISCTRLVEWVREGLDEAGFPVAAASVALTEDDDALEQLTTDDRIRLISFTGSGRVGWKIREIAGAKRVHLELGGVAPVIVDESADLEHAAARVAHGGLYSSGQSCVSAQRAYVLDGVYDEFRRLLIEEVKSKAVGDPYDDGTFTGPMISEKDAERVEAWLGEAVDRGATVVLGGTRDGAVFHPTIVEAAPEDSKLMTEELFGPLVCLQRAASFEGAIERSNATPFGLQAGVFTNRLDRVRRAFAELEFGGVVINDSSATRADAMPYGGVKASGLGREGIRSAMDALTEERTLLLTGR
jgi:acyl-CoA reductase-like NAD-dependent aldehyde dehydrogenase